MFGLGDWGVTLAFVGAILSGVICVVYGARNWNKPSDQARTVVLENQDDKKMEQAV